jgi:hypothetical protein
MAEEKIGELNTEEGREFISSLRDSSDYRLIRFGNEFYWVVPKEHPPVEWQPKVGGFTSLGEIASIRGVCARGSKRVERYVVLMERITVDDYSDKRMSFQDRFTRAERSRREDTD